MYFCVGVYLLVFRIVYSKPRKIFAAIKITNNCRNRILNCDFFRKINLQCYLGRAVHLDSWLSPLIFYWRVLVFLLRCDRTPILPTVRTYLLHFISPSYCENTRRIRLTEMALQYFSEAFYTLKINNKLASLL